MQPVLKEQPVSTTQVQEQEGVKSVKFEITKFMTQFMKTHKGTLDKLAK